KSNAPTLFHRRNSNRRLFPGLWLVRFASFHQSAVGAGVVFVFFVHYGFGNWFCLGRLNAFSIPSHLGVEVSVCARRDMDCAALLLLRHRFSRTFRTPI